MFDEQVCETWKIEMTFSESSCETLNIKMTLNQWYRAIGIAGQFNFFCIKCHRPVWLELLKSCMARMLAYTMLWQLSSTRTIYNDCQSYRHSKLSNWLNHGMILILENAVTTFGLRDAIHPSLKVLQNTHENASTTVVAFKSRTRTR